MANKKFLLTYATYIDGYHIMDTFEWFISLDNLRAFIEKYCDDIVYVYEIIDYTSADKINLEKYLDKLGIKHDS